VQATAQPRPGLSSAEAATRLAASGPNLLPGSTPKPAWAIVRGVLTEPMFMMLLAAGGIYLALGDRAEALFLLGFVFAVIGITLVQERRTQRALESLRELSAPRARVRRDGRELRVAGSEVVRGDLLLLDEGERVAADGVLLSGALAANESLLTGEAVPVDKAAGDAVHASTVVTRGRGEVDVSATGAATAVGRIGAALAATVEPPSQLQLESVRLVRRLGLLALVLALALVLLGWLWDGRTLLASLLAGIALAMAILPEEIPVILTVFMALGAWRIAQQKVLTRRASAVEALGAITVLAVDKTGTLTMNRMAVAELATAEAHFSIATQPAALPEALHPLAEFALLATPAAAYDPMELALQEFGRRWLAGSEHVHDGQAPEFEYALSGEMLAMTRVFAGPGIGQPQAPHLLATKGAPEAVADLCHLDAARRDAVRAQVEDMAARGLRVLGVARGRWSGVAAPGAAPGWPASQHDFDFEFLGLVGLADPPRPEVPAAVAQCRQAGVRLIMMTGDHPATARAIARQVGLSERDAVLMGHEIDALDDAALLGRLRESDICARLQPAHKLRLVQVLRGAGEVVAMTGDGVNDAPALKAADVGIAMGERGTDVAREAAALVLLDDSFARIVAAVAQGRRIYDNIVMATRFTCAVHVPIILLALVPALLKGPALLLPVHIVLLELLIDPACSVVFEADPAVANAMSRPPRSRGDTPFAAANLWRGALQGLGLALLMLVGHALLAAQGEDPAQPRSAVFAALVLSVGLLVWTNRQRPHGGPGRNPWRLRLAVLVPALLTTALAVPALRQVMGLAWPDARTLAAVALMTAAGAAWLALLRGRA
jgi:Ca2+-transporting ATPase